jgi:alkanesulfonate monooxygenase SsuD/methylene tetrahydromethanopterin reductase-like flavin-dependent oxidoreductase (luciferase family)
VPAGSSRSTGRSFEFGSFSERFLKLEEALAILKPMLREERPSFDGRFYRTEGVVNQPPSLQEGGPTIMIGGAGERKTLRLVAEHAHESNLPCHVDEVPRKLEVLERHCKAVGRGRGTIGVSVLFSLIVAPTTGEAEAQRNKLLARRGLGGARCPRQ